MTRVSSVFWLLGVSHLSLTGHMISLRREYCCSFIAQKIWWRSHMMLSAVSPKMRNKNRIKWDWMYGGVKWMRNEITHETYRKRGVIERIEKSSLIVFLCEQDRYGVFTRNDTCSAPRPCVQRKREMEWAESLWINWHVALYSEKLSDGRLSSVNERFTSLALHDSFWPPSAGFVARASDGV